MIGWWWRPLVWAFHRITSSTPTQQEPQRSQQDDHTLVKEDFYVVGTQYYADAIKRLTIKNPDWDLSLEQLIEQGKIAKPIYRYRYKNKPAELVPEPTNKHDKNAVKVVIAGEKVGYISADDNVHVLDLLYHREIKYVSSFFSGGEYKVAASGGDVQMLENHFSIKVRIGYV